MPLYRADGAFTNITATGSLAGMPSPSSHSLVAWAYDPVMTSGGTLPTNGTVYLSAVYPARTANITKIYWHVQTAGVTPTAGQNEVGLYSSAGTRLRAVNVDSDITSTGLKTATITAQTVTAGEFYWVAMVWNAVTPPAPGRVLGGTATVAAMNAGLSASTYRFATNATSQTSLPASITPSSNAQTTFAGPWAAIDE